MTSSRWSDGEQRMVGSVGASRRWRSRESIRSKSAGVAFADVLDDRDDAAVGHAGQVQLGVQREPGATVDAVGLRVRARREHATQAAARVGQCRLEQGPSDALPLEAGPDGVRREHPQQVAPERHREAGELTARLGDPAAARVGVQEVVGAGDPSTGSRRGHASATRARGSAARTSRRRCRRPATAPPRQARPRAASAGSPGRSRSPTLATDADTAG